PRVEERVGERLARGEQFCEVVEPERQQVEVAVPQADAGLLAAGLPVKIKLNAYPTRALRGRVERVGVSAALEGEERVFLARVRLEPPTPELRSGMTGQAKIDTGSKSVARVLLRRPARWLWGRIWGWLP
ncbi:MAG TPA: HlyD family secretion protein, partial [Candidatus Polarisedimenticolaceae bacterium]|nr:HlyD family secretion protein [Candidatus Polarisedimenticolaceae bacterium]